MTTKSSSRRSAAWWPDPRIVLVVPEVGELLNGDHPGRTSETEITLFRSLGLAVEDIAAAHLVYERAMESSAWVPESNSIGRLPRGEGAGPG